MALTPEVGDYGSKPKTLPNSGSFICRKGNGMANAFYQNRGLRKRPVRTLCPKEDPENPKKTIGCKDMAISSGGAGILIDNPNLQPGQNLFLHFQPGDGVPPFNAVCTVVSKQMVKDTKSALDSVKYGVKFTSISQSVRESIRQFTQKVA